MIGLKPVELLFLVVVGFFTLSALFGVIYLSVRLALRASRGERGDQR